MLGTVKHELESCQTTCKHIMPSILAAVVSSDGHGVGINMCADDIVTFLLSTSQITLYFDSYPLRTAIKSLFLLLF